MINSELASAMWEHIVPLQDYAKSMSDYINKKGVVVQELLDAFIEILTHSNLFLSDGETVNEEVLSPDWFYTPIQVVNEYGDVYRVPGISLAKALNRGFNDNSDDMCSLTIETDSYDTTLGEFCSLFCSNYMDKDQTEYKIIPPFDVTVVAQEPLLLEGNVVNVISAEWVNNNVNQMVRREEEDLVIDNISVSATLSLLSDMVIQATSFTTILDELGNASDTTSVSSASIVTRITQKLRISDTFCISDDIESCVSIASDNRMDIDSRLRLIFSRLVDDEDVDALTSGDNLIDYHGVSLDLTNYSGTPISAMYGISSCQTVVENAYNCVKTVVSIGGKVIGGLINKVKSFATNAWKKHVEPLYQAKDFVEGEKEDSDSYVDLPAVLGTDGISPNFKLDVNYLTGFIEDALGDSKEIVYNVINPDASQDSIVTAAYGLPSDSSNGDYLTVRSVHPFVDEANMKMVSNSNEKTIQLSDMYETDIDVNFNVTVTRKYVTLDGEEFADITTEPSIDKGRRKPSLRVYDSNSESSLIYSRQGDVARTIFAEDVVSKYAYPKVGNCFSDIFGENPALDIERLTLHAKFSYYGEQGVSEITLGVGDHAESTLMLQGPNPYPVLEVRDSQNNCVLSSNIFSTYGNDREYGEVHVDLSIPGWSDDSVPLTEPAFVNLEIGDLLFSLKVSLKRIMDDDGFVMDYAYIVEDVNCRTPLIYDESTKSYKQITGFETPGWLHPEYHRPKRKIELLKYPEIIYEVKLTGGWRFLGVTDSDGVRVGLLAQPEKAGYYLDLTPLHSDNPNIVSISGMKSVQSTGTNRVYSIKKKGYWNSVDYGLEASGGLVSINISDHLHFDPVNGVLEKISGDRQISFSDNILYPDNTRFMYQWINNHSAIRYNSRTMYDLSSNALAAIQEAIHNPVDGGCALTMRTHFCSIQMSRQGDDMAGAVYLNPIDHTKILTRQGSFFARVSGVGTIEILSYDGQVEQVVTGNEFGSILLARLSDIRRDDFEPYSLGEEGDVLVWKDLYAAGLLTDMLGYVLSNPTHDVVSMLDGYGYVRRFFTDTPWSKATDGDVTNLDLVEVVRQEPLGNANMGNFWSGLLGAVILNKTAIMSAWFKITGEFPSFVPYRIGLPLRKPRWHIQTDSELANVAERAITLLLIAAAVVAAIFVGVKLKKARAKRLRKANLKREVDLQSKRNAAINKQTDVNAHTDKLKDLKEQYKTAKANGNAEDASRILEEISSEKSSLKLARKELSKSIDAIEKSERKLSLVNRITSIMGYKPKASNQSAPVEKSTFWSKIIDNSEDSTGDQTDLADIRAVCDETSVNTMTVMSNMANESSVSSIIKAIAKLATSEEVNAHFISIGDDMVLFEDHLIERMNDLASESMINDKSKIIVDSISESITATNLVTVTEGERIITKIEELNKIEYPEPD